MSLNKFTDSSVEKLWMNINCNDLRCNTFECKECPPHITSPLKFVLTQEVVVPPGQNSTYINFLEPTAGVGNYTYKANTDKVGDIYHFIGSGYYDRDNTTYNDQGLEIVVERISHPTYDRIVDYKDGLTPNNFYRSSIDVNMQSFTMEVRMECVAINGTESTFNYQVNFYGGLVSDTTPAVPLSNLMLMNSVAYSQDPVVPYPVINPLFLQGTKTIPNNQDRQWKFMIRSNGGGPLTAWRSSRGQMFKYTLAL